MADSQHNDIYVCSGAPTLKVEAKAVRIGADILVYIWGGSHPHIGAVAAAQPRPSLKDASRSSSTSSVLTFLGHKEDEVVKQVSEHLSGALETHVVVTAGIHWDNLGQSDIKSIGARIDDVTRQLAHELGKQENGS